MKMNLLTLGNPKVMKGQAAGYLTAILHLAPSRLSGYNVCPRASAGCAAACLNTAGRGGMFRKGETTNLIQQARIRRTQALFGDRDTFLELLVADVEKVIRQAAKLNLTPAIRLNGTSDLRWEVMPVVRNGVTYPNIMTAFPDIQFYDYTKMENRRELPANYHLTFSLAEDNDERAQVAMANGLNVAVVFFKVPAEYKGRPVVDGDATDLRFLDPKQVVVGLKAKGRAKRDVSGFVR